MPPGSCVSRLLSAPLRARTSVAVPDRVACAKDLWQRHLIRTQHGKASELAALPAAVVRVARGEEVEELVGLARREGLSLVPYGAGSGVCGAVECGPRTLVVDTKLMRGHAVTDSGTLRVGPGALGISLEDELARSGLTVGHFPSSILCSTVGGWVAARGAGQCSGRYGKIEDMTLSASAVLGTGERVTARRRDAGPSLLPLLIGSEGTLGVFTELELRLHAAPAQRAFLAYELPTVEAGTEALRSLFQAGIRPAVARLYDPLDSALAGSSRHHPVAEPSQLEPLRENRHAHLSRLLGAPRLLNAALGMAEKFWLKKTKLVLVFEGPLGETEDDAERARRLLGAAGARSLGEEPARRWYRRRYGVSYEQSPIFRHAVFSDTFEVAAPWSRLLGVYEAVRRALGRHVLVMAHMSHAYPDGCSIYFTFVGSSRDENAVHVHETLWRDALEATLEAGGTISHHHGVGRLRSQVLERELGTGGIAALGALKDAWDPERVLCPGSPLGPGAEVAVAAPHTVGARTNPEHTRASLVFDDVSALVCVGGARRLRDAEQALRDRGRTLSLRSVPELDLATWVGRGMPGAPDTLDDPLEQRLAGFAALLGGGQRVELSPAPRRATGPDLSALLVGAEGRIARLEHAWLRTHPLQGEQVRKLPFSGERAPGMGHDERVAWERALGAFGVASPG